MYSFLRFLCSQFLVLVSFRLIEQRVSEEICPAHEAMNAKCAGRISSSAIYPISPGDPCLDPGDDHTIRKRSFPALRSASTARSSRDTENESPGVVRRRASARLWPAPPPLLPAPPQLAKCTKARPSEVRRRAAAHLWPAPPPLPAPPQLTKCTKASPSEVRRRASARLWPAPPPLLPAPPQLTE